MLPPAPHGSSDFRMAGATATPEGDNPLARFSLPSLPVPSAGEASLFSEPPPYAYHSLGASTATYSNLAYGAYPPAGPASPSHLASLHASGQPPNVIERLETVRRRWASPRTASPNASTAGPSNHPAAAGGSTTVPTEEASTTSFTAAEKGKGKEVESSSLTGADQAEAEAEVSPREAALRAAEKRLARTAPKAGEPTWLPSPATSAPVHDREPPTVIDGDTPQADAGAEKAKARPDQPLPTPRLIPLFDPANPTPSLAESCPWTPLRVEGAVTKALEDKLRTLSEFQQRLDGLVADLRAAVGT